MLLDFGDWAERPHDNSFTMKILQPVGGVFLLLWPVVEAEESETLSIPEPMASGIEVVPASPPEPIDFEVRSAWTKRLEVRESPPMAGLPPVTGTINLTMRRVDDPGLPDPPLPPTPRPIIDPDLLAAIEEFKRNYKGSEFMLVSGMVHDHSRSFLRTSCESTPTGPLKSRSRLGQTSISTTSAVSRPSG